MNYTTEELGHLAADCDAQAFATGVPADDRAILRQLAQDLRAAQYDQMDREKPFSRTVADPVPARWTIHGFVAAFLLGTGAVAIALMALGLCYLVKLAERMP